MLSDDAYPSEDLTLDLLFTWQLPPLAHGPDLLVLATELAGISGTELPTQVSAVDSFTDVTDQAERSLGVTSRLEVPLAVLFHGDENSIICDALDRCSEISDYLLNQVPAWLGSD